jgi:hypothetical protein
VIERRQIITVLIWALAACAISRAGMMPVSPLDAAGCRPSSPADTLADLRPGSPFLLSPGFPGVADLGSSFAGFLPPLNPKTGEPGGTKPAQILTDRQNSLELCLYALLSLGLCRSAPFIRKLHLGGIPGWYYSGGPYQIGHSFAISPDCLLSTPVLCFVQPDSIAATQDPLRECCPGFVVALWRQSQFARAVLASRGPPPC